VGLGTSQEAKVRGPSRHTRRASPEARTPSKSTTKPLPGPAWPVPDEEYKGPSPIGGGRSGAAGWEGGGCVVSPSAFVGEVVCAASKEGSGAAPLARACKTSAAALVVALRAASIALPTALPTAFAAVSRLEETRDRSPPSSTAPTGRPGGGEEEGARTGQIGAAATTSSANVFFSSGGLESEKESSSGGSVVDPRSWAAAGPSPWAEAGRGSLRSGATGSGAVSGGGFDAGAEIGAETEAGVGVAGSVSTGARSGPSSDRTSTRAGGSSESAPPGFVASGFVGSGFSIAGFFGSPDRDVFGVFSGAGFGGRDGMAVGTATVPAWSTGSVTPLSAAAGYSSTPGGGTEAGNICCFAIWGGGGC